MRATQLIRPGGPAEIGEGRDFRLTDVFGEVVEKMLA